MCVYALVEGLALLDLDISPYSGDVFHETPLVIYFFHFLVDYAEITFMCTCGLNNAVVALFILSTIRGSALLSAIFLALATYQSIYPVTLCVPALLYLMQRLYIPVNVWRSGFWLYTLQYLFMFLGSLLVLVGLSFFLLNTWDFLPAVYGFILSVPDLTPNIGLFWYFFAEMFDHFRLFFLCVFQINVFFYTAPLSIKLKDHPVFLIFMQIAVIAIFKSYPTVGDLSLYLAFLPVWNHLYRCKDTHTHTHTHTHVLKHTHTHVLKHTHTHTLKHTHTS
ncbi:hypothetical protein CRUP_016272 [Coryphaenoides rupestris]|nr:hypothetical protein CRUP_016272 [Coryphaenoides rupestris]